MRVLWIILSLAIVGACGAQVNVPPLLNTDYVVTSFGAYADGSHESETTAAFNAALMAAQATPGGRVIVPAGTFTVTTGLQILGNLLTLDIRGSSDGRSILRFDGPGDGIFIGTHGTKPVFTHLNISDIQLDGSLGATNGLHIVNTGDITLTHVTIQKFTNDGIQADSAQYLHISDTVLAANAGWGFDALPPRINVAPPTNLGVQNNGFLFTNAFFISNGTAGSPGSGGGYRLIAAREITFVGCTVQDNRAYGAVMSGDVAGALGGLPPGPVTGEFSDNIRSMSTHFEFNRYQNEVIQFAQNITDLNPVFASNFAVGGDYYVDGITNPSLLPLVSHLVLINPFFTSVGPNITIPGGANDEIETGNAGSVYITYSALSSSLVHNGGSVISTLTASNINFQPGAGYTLGDSSDATITDTLTLARAGIRLKSVSGSLGIDLLPQGGTNPFTLMGTATTQRFLTMPDATGTMALTSQLPLSATTGSLGGSPLAAGKCASTTIPLSGTNTGMTVTASAAAGTDPGDTFVPRAYVSSAGNVTVKVCAITSGTPTATTYNVRVLP